jgi:hypothetical protein
MLQAGRGILLMVTIRDPQRAFDGFEDLRNRDRARLPRQEVPSLRPVVAFNESAFCERLENLGQELYRDIVFLSNLPRVDDPGAGDRTIVSRRDMLQGN